MFERWKTRRRVKKFLARDPGYLSVEQQEELGLVPRWAREWSHDFLLGWEDSRKPYTMILKRPTPPTKKEPITQTVHPAIAALRNIDGKPMTLAPLQHPVRLP